MRSPAAIEELVIEAGRTEKNYWLDLWRYRELFFIYFRRTEKTFADVI